MESRDEVVQEAIRAHLAGQLAKAADGYKRVVVHDPGDVGAINLLGVFFYQREAPQQAALLLGRAIHVNPGVAEFYNNLALAQIDLEAFADALRSAQLAIILRPDYAEATVNLGAVLRELGRGAEAEIMARRAIALIPSSAAGWNNLGLTLRNRGRHGEAIAALRLAVCLDPGHAKAFHNLGLTWMDLGQPEAEGSMARSLRLVPDQTHYFRNFAVLHRFKRPDEWLLDMERLLADLPNLGLNRQIELHFALAKAYEDVGERDQGFSHLMRANTLKRRKIFYDEPAALDLFRRIRTVFDAPLLRRYEGAGDPSEIPVFIVGMPRSGTSLIEQILASHSQIHAAGELSEFGRQVDALAARHGGQFPELVQGLDPAELESLGREYVAAISSKAAGARFVTDKMPGNLPFAGMIGLALPRARIIMVERDPIDTCLSCFSKNFAGALSYTYDLAELGRFAHAYGELRAHWQSVLPPDRLLTVRYEDVVADLEVEARRLVAFCGLPWEPGCLEYHRTQRAVRTASVAQVRQPIYASSVGRWRPADAIIAPLLLGLRGENNDGAA